jgi:hypothetical protein
MMIVMFVTGRPLATAVTPQGIICLEFAKTEMEVEQVLSAWTSASSQNTNILHAARVNTYLDFIFLSFYSLFLFVFCRRLADGLSARKMAARAFHLLSMLALFAGFLDVLENIGMLASLHGRVSDTTSLYTAISAGLKWIIVLVIILSLGGGLIYKKWFLKSTSRN